MAPAEPLVSPRPQATARVHNPQEPCVPSEPLHRQELGGIEQETAEGRRQGSAFPDINRHHVPTLGSNCTSSSSHASCKCSADPPWLSNEQTGSRSAKDPGESVRSSSPPRWRRDDYKDIYNNLLGQCSMFRSTIDPHVSDGAQDISSSCGARLKPTDWSHKPSLFGDTVHAGFKVSTGSTPPRRFTVDVASELDGHDEYSFQYHSDINDGGRASGDYHDFGQQYRSERERHAQRLAELRSMFAKGSYPTAGAGNFEVPRFPSWH